MAHIAGLLAAEAHLSSVPVAEIITSTTHKTLRGPRGGLIIAGADLSARLNSSIFPGLQGGLLMITIAAKAVAFKEALTPEFNQYQCEVVKNTAVLSNTFRTRC